MIRYGFKRETVYGELKIGGGEVEGLPGVVGYRKGLVESGSEVVEEWRVRRGRDSGVHNQEGNRLFTLYEGYESDVELEVGLSHYRENNIRLMDANEGFIKVASMSLIENLESSDSAGLRGRPIGGGGLNDGPDFGP